MKQQAKKTTREKPSRDHYQEVTDKIIAALEAGTRHWQRPWDPEKASGPAMPFNAAIGHRYRGINTLLLGMSPFAFMSGDPRWCSYKQAAEKGWQVRKGEKATTVFFFKQLVLEDPKAPVEAEDSTRRIPMLLSFSVFHATQIDGIPAFAPPETPKALWQRLEDADLILKNSKAVIRTGGDRAFYSPVTDHIQLPPDSAFQSAAGHAATAHHELGNVVSVLLGGLAFCAGEA
jgi:antirestriction protein ArdC